jgi:prepilin-type N-terminal cleavage/methylation domain-containing protein
MNMNKIGNRQSAIGNTLAFTLTELLVVISIMGVLAGFTIPVLKSAKAAQYKKAARGELEFIETALDNYKAKYGTYPPGNALPATATYQPALFSQLYYELAGTAQNGTYFVTLDGSAQIPVASVSTAYGAGVGGFLNCTKGTGEDGLTAKNFLVGLNHKNIYSYVTNNGVPTTEIVTSVGGPDDSYQPLSAAGLNPFRYVYPGVNNPGGYDLWVQLVINGKTNLICNWSRQVQINSPLP